MAFKIKDDGPVFNAPGYQRPTLRQRLDAIIGEQLTPRTIGRIELMMAEAMDTGEVNDPDILRAFEVIMPQVEQAKALANMRRTQYAETLWPRFKAARSDALRLSLLDRIIQERNR